MRVETVLLFALVSTASVFQRCESFTCSSRVQLFSRFREKSALKPNQRAANPIWKVPAVSVKLKAEGTSGGKSWSPYSSTNSEATMDAKMKGLGVSWYQALMVIFVAMVYAADGAEVTVMSLVSKEVAAKFGLASWEKGLLGMSVYTGMFTGGLVAGPIADTKGRSLALLASTLLISVFGVASAYVPSFKLLCAARFIAGIGMGASLPVSSSLLQETVPARWKGGLACLVFSGFNIGEFYAAKMGVRAFGRPDPSSWLFLVAALPAVLTFAASIAVPESPRFLAARGESAAVAKWFRRACALNRKPVAELFPEGLEQSAKDMCAPAALSREKYSATTDSSLDAGRVTVGSKRAGLKSKLRGIFKPGGLRLRTLVLWTLWCSANTAFYGMIFSLPEALQHVKNVAGDNAFDISQGISRISVYQSLAFLLYMPLVSLGVSFGTLFQITLFGAFATLGYATFAAQGIVAMTPAKVVTALAISKLFYNGIFMMLYPLTGLSYPTEVRATGTALAGTVGRICTIMVPPVCIRLQQISPMLPYKVFTAVSGAAFISSLLL